MPTPPVFRAVLMAGVAFAASALVTPASAKEEIKPIVVTIPAAALKDDTSRLCMSREIFGRKVDKSLPQTICQTRAAWAAQNVIINLK